MTPAEQSFAAQLEQGGHRADPAFVRALRQGGRDCFLRVKLPTSKHEDWRFTSLAALGARSFLPAPARSSTAGQQAAPRLVFQNGRLDLGASDLSGLPAGARVGSLATALRERPEVVEHLLGQVGTPLHDHAFVALNAGLFEDGALVEIEDGVTCERPINLVFCSQPVGPTPIASHPRNLLVVGRGARAVVVEHYCGEGNYLVNAVTEVALGEAARLEHDRLQEDGREGFHVGILSVEQAAGSRFVGQSLALGAMLARVEGRVLLGGEEATCELNGLYLAGGTQVRDHFVHVDHARPCCVSREVFKGILDGASRGVFTGRVHVREGARKTDAGQVNSNLILSEDATIDTRPQLEILNDDVKCWHGGAVGQIGEEQLFYLRSRGLSEPMARALLAWAFASEMVERVGPMELRALLKRAVTARLPHGALLREVA
ncbi:MAG TPA: Fe-S cluster assembly protein SufD [Anaeromyxobacteraceae bacterium]|nr:Fe-S cluster assembly protein SufD [Anaeromyxobacteraceae bacterium]